MMGRKIFGTLGTMLSFAMIAGMTIHMSVNAAVEYGWETVDGNAYWYEGGVKQGTEGRGKEIYDPGSDAWYWLDAVDGGRMAKGKDVYQESVADAAGTMGKWVRYDSDGHMIKGWDTNENGTYYFDLVYGTMAKGNVRIDGKDYFFHQDTGVLENGGISPAPHWETIDGKKYWYEGGVRQGYDAGDPNYRGKEIYDPGSDAWYWLDNVQQGACAVNKDVYQESQADDAGHIGKWVRYDGEGHMVKGWDTNENGKYYFDPVYGTMARGIITIDNITYHFNEKSGICEEKGQTVEKPGDGGVDKPADEYEDSVKFLVSYAEYEFSITDGCNLDVTPRIGVSYSHSSSSPQKPQFSYVSDNENVLKVQDNHVYMAGPGTATITISSGKASASVKCTITDKRELENGEKNVVIWNLDGQTGDLFKEQYHVTWRYFTVNQPDVSVTIADDSIASVIECSQSSSSASVELYAKKVGSTKVNVSTRYRDFSFTLNVVPYRSDDNLDEPYMGAFWGPFGIRYENSSIIYQGRIAETNEEVREVLYHDVDEVKQFVDNYLTDDMSDYEKVAAIYRYYSDNHIMYSSSENTCYSWYGMLVEHKAVCEGSCEATAMLARVAGLTVYRCSSSLQNHAWNMVCLDGKFYEIDFTAPRSGNWSETFWLKAVNITEDMKVDVFLNGSVTDITFSTDENGWTTKTYSSHGSEPIPLPIENAATKTILLDLYGDIIDL